MRARRKPSHITCTQRRVDYALVRYKRSNKRHYCSCVPAKRAAKLKRRKKANYYHYMHTKSHSHMPLCEPLKQFLKSSGIRRVEIISSTLSHFKSATLSFRSFRPSLQIFTVQWARKNILCPSGGIENLYSYDKLTKNFMGGKFALARMRACGKGAARSGTGSTPHQLHIHFLIYSFPIDYNRMPSRETQTISPNKLL